MPSDLERFLMVETTQSAATAISGKVKRLDGVYYLRNLGVPPHARDVEGWNQWMAQDFPGFLECFEKHRARMLAFADKQNQKGFDGLLFARAFDMTFLLYVGREFHLGFWLEEYLRGLIDNESEKVSLRFRLEGSRSKLSATPTRTIDRVIRATKHFVKCVTGKNGFAHLKRYRQLLIVTNPSNKGISHFPRVIVSPGIWKRFQLSDWEKIGPILSKFTEK